jgi:ligand-binding sensor domain-containing protein/putative methionine-R-sulfoxide reductase with GAF domain
MIADNFLKSIYKFNVDFRMLNGKFILLLLFTAFLVSGVSAQKSLNYPFRHISQQDGLLHNEVYSITQDDKGFIWIATKNGLQRYDGYNFIRYPELLIDPKDGITYITSLYMDKKNRMLWIGNPGKTEKMDLASNHFTLFDPYSSFKDSVASWPRYTGANNEQWLLGTHAVYYQDSLAKKYSLWNLNCKNSNQLCNIANDSNNTWLVSEPQLLFLNEKNKRVYSGSFNPEHHPLLQRSSYKPGKLVFRFIMTDSRQNIWVTTWGDFLYRYDAKTKKVSTYSLAALKKPQAGHATPNAPPIVNCMLEDDNHTIWIGTDNAGLLRFNKEKDNFDYCIAREGKSESIRYNYKIFTLFQDREQNIWAGTDKGISIFNPYRQYFTSIRHQEKNPLSVSKSEINAFIQTSNGNIFIGTWGGGIALYDEQFNFKKNIFFSEGTEKNLVWCFQQIDAETLWIGCQAGQLLQYNLTTGETKTLLTPAFEKSTIRCMEKDREGNIWFGLHNGKITKWDKRQMRFFAFPSSSKYNLKRPAAVISLIIDKTQHCWVSTTSGFKEFDLEKGVYVNTWLPDKNNTTGISAKNCNGIEELNDSILLIGTIYGGLSFFNKRTKIFSSLTTADGLPSNSIYAIKKDTSGFVWFTTDYGIYKFNPANKKIIPYTIEPGIINSEFTAQRIYPLQNGQWLTYTGTEAISFFPYKQAHPGSSNPKIEITGFKIFDRPVLIDSLLNENKPVELSYKENFFTIEFAALNFSGFQQTNYHYRLNGIDKDWVNSGSTRFASYTDLKPGEYIFEVKAEQGDSSGKVTSFKIIIVPPFWKTWRFITLIAFSILLLSFLLIKGREKNFKTIAAEKLKVQQINAEQYKSRLEMELIVNYFSSSLIGKNTKDAALWDVAKNLIGRLGFTDCMIYLWNDDKNKMIQQAGFGPKGSAEKISQQHFDVLPGQGVVGYVMETKETVLIPDTSKDSRYRADEMTRLSELTVPIIYNDELIGIIDSEHPEKNFFTPQHLQVMNTIATMMANKIKSIDAEQSVRQTNIKMYSINEQLLKAKLEALQSQMNPHFIFNSLNSIDNLIQTNQKEKATTYLARFARLIRNVLDSSKNDVVAFQKDYETLELYLQMEQFRCSNKFSYELLAEDELLQSASFNCTAVRRKCHSPRLAQ